jgi:hypothetical protein
MNKKIPNFDTLSTLLDRLSIENVKLSHFQNAIEYDNLSDEKRWEYEGKISVQFEIIDMLKEKTTNFMKEIFITGEYDYVKEERTFD